MQRLAFLLILALVAGGCCGHNSPYFCPPYKNFFDKPQKSDLNEINYRGLIDVMFGWGAQLRYEKQLLLWDSCAVFNNKVEKIRMEFRSQAILELQEARELLVYVVEGLLGRVNGHMGMQPHLASHPFNVDDLEIIIVFESFFGYFVDPNYNGRLSLVNGIVTYNDFNIYDSSLDVFGCKTESYALSKQLVEIEKRVKSNYSPHYFYDIIMPRHAKERYFIDQASLNPVIEPPTVRMNSMPPPPPFARRQ